MNHRVVGIVSGSAVAALVASGLHAGTPAFIDSTVAAGVAGAENDANAAIYFWLTGGGAVGDFNKDGWQDFVVAGGGDTPDTLWINDGDGTFTESAAAWGIGETHLSGAPAVGDYNNDGWPDIWMSSLGPTTGPAVGHHRLYRNNGDNTFTEVAAAAGVNLTSPTVPSSCGGSWGDYDLDGLLDLITCARTVDTQGNRVFKNNGDGTFTDVTYSIGLDFIDSVHGFAPRLVDLNKDRHPELVFIGDGSTTRYYINDGDGTFTEATANSNMVLGEAEMGFTIADFDGDSRFDAYVTTKGRNNLYMNNNNHVFVDEGLAAGVKFTGWGWGASAIDFDHDTRPDIVTHSQITGNPNAHPWAFRNITPEGGDVLFENVTSTVGLPSNTWHNNGRGLARLDHDNDGDQDFICFNYNEPIILWENTLSGPDINWLRVFLDATGEPGLTSNGAGSVIRVTVGGKNLFGRIDSGTNYLSQDEDSAHFGLAGNTTVTRVRVEWPDGRVTTVNNVAVNQTLTLTPPPLCTLSGDVNDDDSVDFTDLNHVLGLWGQVVAPEDDIIVDGTIDFADLNAVLGSWGQSCP